MLSCESELIAKIVLWSMRALHTVVSKPSSIFNLWKSLRSFNLLFLATRSMLALPHFPGETTVRLEWIIRCRQISRPGLDT